MKTKSRALQSRKDYSWSSWANKKERYKKTGSTMKIDSSNAIQIGKGTSHLTGNKYNH